MVSNLKFSDILTAFIVILQRVFLLIALPHRTMRRISLDTNTTAQLVLLLLGAGAYFVLSEIVRGNPHLFTVLGTYLVFLTLVCVTITFFYYFSRLLGAQVSLKRLISTYIYSLIPTFFWFTGNALLYLLIPPPRTPSFEGRLLSILFIIYSLSLLFWKAMLLYLTLRFSTTLLFYRIMYVILMYTVVMGAVSVVLYNLGVFRVPFI